MPAGRRNGLISAVAFISLSACGITLCGDAKLPPEQVEFFENKIRPVLAERCYSCHSTTSGKKLQANLFLDHKDGILKGGDNGPAVVPGDPGKSMIIRAIGWQDDELMMPPKQKLTPEQIADFTAWVKMGAPDPRVDKPQAGGTIAKIDAANHWAYKRPTLPPLPEVKNKKWVKTPVDNFILAKLDAKKLKPSPPADKRTLLRRVTFDLTGLPPTPEEIAAFENDKSADAYAKVIDRLLASPKYGERWGRHWLDVARYADTKGYVFQEERRYPYSYTYRDWVIRAFNEDMPYDQFITLQLAADKIVQGEDKRALAAMGFLTVGRRFINNIHDIIDDRIDLVFRGTMGLTVGCARCHDHKYDPIPTKDYYSIYGVFASSFEPQPLPEIGRPEDNKSNPQFPDFEKQLAEKKNKVVEYIEKRAGEILVNMRKPENLKAYLTTIHEVLVSKNYDLHRAANKKDLIPVIAVRWFHFFQTTPEQYKPVANIWNAYANLPANEFAQKAAGLPQVLAKGPHNKALLDALIAKPPASMNDVIDQFVAALSKVNVPQPQGDPVQEQLRQVLYGAGGVFDITVKRGGPDPDTAECEQLFKRDDHDKIRELRNAVMAVQVTHPGAPPRAMVLNDAPNPHNVQVFVRGNPGNRGEQAPRRFVEVVAGKDSQPFKDGSGRLELARAIVSKDNPLTARVLVNRLWTQHFGAGLVRTPSDFGVRTEPPSHPELLDYLACKFIEQGWSIKQMHRMLLLSNTYQQRSDDVPEGRAADSENTLLWRMNRRRLDFEALRDGLLAVAGKLDGTMFGRPVEIFSDPLNTRRTVYGYIDRQNLPMVLRTFDFASPDAHSPQRYQTSVPQQALFMMNSPFALEQARRVMLRDDVKSAADDNERVQRLFALVLNRKATKDELKLALSYIQEAEADAKEASPDADVWKYGYGSYDEAKKKVTFKGLPHFTGQSYQGGVSIPDPKLGWTVLTPEGGHPGNDAQHCAIRRWVAPCTGTITIQGTLSHPAPEGNGVLGRIVSNLAGEKGNWIVHNKSTETPVDQFEVKQGEIIDFIIDNRGDVGFDSFAWAPVIRLVDKDRKWDAEADFAGPERKPLKPLTGWEKFAQVLLLTNEFMFVD